MIFFLLALYVLGAYGIMIPLLDSLSGNRKQKGMKKLDPSFVNFMVYAAPILMPFLWLMGAAAFVSGTLSYLLKKK